MPPMVSAWLNFLIFGNLIGRKLGSFYGYSYLEFIISGLILLSVIISCYTNVASSLFSARFQRYIEEILIAPIPSSLIVLGFVCGGVVRGILVGGLVFSVACCFVTIDIYSLLHVFMMGILTTILFSLGGFINAVYASNFDSIALIPSLLLTPLIYLGGVFYPIEILPPFWQNVSLYNPLLYMIDTFRYGFLGANEYSLYLSYSIVSLFIISFFVWSLYLLNCNKGIRP